MEHLTPLLDREETRPLAEKMMAILKTREQATPLTRMLLDWMRDPELGIYAERLLEILRWKNRTDPISIRITGSPELTVATSWDMPLSTWGRGRCATLHMHGKWWPIADTLPLWRAMRNLVGLLGECPPMPLEIHFT